MPNFDGGHYFLTVFAPIRTASIVEPFLGRAISHEHLLAEKLSMLPTGEQTVKSVSVAGAAFQSPLSRNSINHLARFVIIDGPAFNGRASQDLIIASLQKINPLVPQPVDRLTTPYLLFAADLDAPGDGPGAGEAGLRAYTDELWATMREDLQDIFRHCYGFENVTTAEGFHDYIRRCQVETTMPFNDYWANGLVGELKKLGLLDVKLPLGATKFTGILAVATLIVWLGALALTTWFGLGARTGPRVHIVAEVAAWGPLAVAATFGLLALAIYQLYQWVMKSGARLFPRAPGSDLPTVLKSLFIQQNFTRFAIEAQGLDDAALHQRFGSFLAVVQPSAATPTQAPGEVRADQVEWLR